MSCEDFPCCGHEPGCCPNYGDDGRQLDMVCTCGARLPVTSRYSICNSCMAEAAENDNDYDRRYNNDDDHYLDFDEPLDFEMDDDDDRPDDLWNDE